MNNSIELIESWNLPLDLCARLAAQKTKIYIEIFEVMDKHGGWLPNPDWLVNYLKTIGATHWADLYFRDGVLKVFPDYKEMLASIVELITQDLGADIGPEAAREYCIAALSQQVDAMNTEDDNLERAVFGQFDFGSDDPSDLSPEQLKQHAEFWLAYYLLFYNDLSLAAHAESIVSLVRKAIDNNDDEALVKAIQVDRSLYAYFRDRVWHQSMRGNSDFFDSLAYRSNNPTLRGKNEHPLLWIFLNDLHGLGCLRKAITSRQLLDQYQQAISNHVKYSIDDVLVVQRQRRRFTAVNGQPK
jgi:hypothetical protein